MYMIIAGQLVEMIFLQLRAKMHVADDQYSAAGILA